MPFTSVIGHRPVVALLQQAVGRRRVPQSLLFAGPDGVGKRAVAVALAQAVNCPNRTGGDACGTCSTCTRIERGQHSDVTVLDKGDEASIKIKPVRERILDVIGYRPFEAERRVFIIDPADDLTFEAQDALLKTLEEPPPSAILILITAYPDTLRPTIQSRCRRLRFGPIAERDVRRILVERAGIAPAQADVLAAASGGSVGRALAASSGDLADDRDAALGLLRASAKGLQVQSRLKAAAAFAQVGSKRRIREAVSTRLSILAGLLRDLGAMATGVREPQLLAHADLAADLGELSAGFPLARVSEGYGVVDRAQAHLERNAGPKIVADWVALAL